MKIWNFITKVSGVVSATAIVWIVLTIAFQERFGELLLYNVNFGTIIVVFILPSPFLALVLPIALIILAAIAPFCFFFKHKVLCCIVTSLYVIETMNLIYVAVAVHFDTSGWVDFRLAVLVLLTFLVSSLFCILGTVGVFKLKESKTETTEVNNAS